MIWFDLAFPAAMLLFPVLFVALSPRGAPGAQTPESRARANTLMLSLIAATSLAVVVHLVLWWLRVPFTSFTAALFFPLWFGLAMPALAARNPDLAHAHPGGTPIRRASLTPREHAPLAPRWLWVLAIVIAALMVFGTAIRPWADHVLSALGFADSAIGFTQSARAAWLRSIIIQPVVLLIAFATLYGCIGMLRREPEPLDARASPQLTQAYQDLRRFKAMAFLWLFGVGGSILFGGAMLAMAWIQPDSRALILVLAIGGSAAGSALGIAGGVVGTVAGLRRAKINAMIRDLNATPHASADVRPGALP